MEHYKEIIEGDFVRYNIYLKEPIGIVKNSLSKIETYFNVMLASQFGTTVKNERFGGTKSGLWIIDKFDLVSKWKLSKEDIDKSCKILKGTISNFIC